MGKKILYGAGLVAAGITGYLIGSSKSVDPDAEVELKHGKQDNNMLRESTQRVSLRGLSNDKKLLESQLDDAKTLIAQKDAELAKYKPFQDSLNIASYIKKAGSDVPISALKGLDANGGIAYLDKNSGSLYVNTRIFNSG